MITVNWKSYFHFALQSNFGKIKYATVLSCPVGTCRTANKSFSLLSFYISKHSTLKRHFQSITAFFDSRYFRLCPDQPIKSHTRILVSLVLTLQTFSRIFTRLSVYGDSRASGCTRELVLVHLLT